MKKSETSPTVYIVEPYEHGNGGCYGSGVLEKLSLEDALKKNPLIDYDVDEGSHPAGFWPRICASEDMNDALYLWDEDNRKWKSAK